MTVERYHSLAEKGDRHALSLFIVERFNEKYFSPIENSPSKHGFASLAIACLVVETIESFYQGLPDTKYKSKKMFRDFFGRDTAFKEFADGDWFYEDIRCGILHQGETCGGWRIWRRGPILDKKNKTINATKFLRALQFTVQQYSTQVVADELLWNNFQKKMSAVCANCEAP